MGTGRRIKHDYFFSPFFKKPQIMIHPNVQFWLFARAQSQPVSAQALTTPHSAMNSRAEQSPPKFCHELFSALPSLNLLSPGLSDTFGFPCLAWALLLCWVFNASPLGWCAEHLMPLQGQSVGRHRGDPQRRVRKTNSPQRFSWARAWKGCAGTSAEVGEKSRCQWHQLTRECHQGRAC